MGHRAHLSITETAAVEPPRLGLSELDFRHPIFANIRALFPGLKVTGYDTSRDRSLRVY